MTEPSHSIQISVWFTCWNYTHSDKTIRIFNNILIISKNYTKSASLNGAKWFLEGRRNSKKKKNLCHSYSSVWSICKTRSALFAGLIIYNTHAHTLCIFVLVRVPVSSNRKCVTASWTLSRTTCLPPQKCECRWR